MALQIRLHKIFLQINVIKTVHLKLNSRKMTVCDSGDVKLDAAVNSWLIHDKNPDTRQEVFDYISRSQWEKLRHTMLKRQKFGTAGLRGRMGAGYMCINDVVILQTAQGLCSYMVKKCTKNQLQNGLVVGYDGRYNSKRFAELTAKVFISASIPVHLFSTVVPTPLVSFATILYKAAGGVMVTASHNPKWDNGYKVYWSNGSQLLTPHDDNVLEEVLSCLEIPDEHWNIKEIRAHELVTDCTQDAISKYMEYIRESLSAEVLETNRRAGIPIVYSAMHGVGYSTVVQALETAGFKPPLSVIEQQDPNPDFPTADFPNPEEPGCLALSQRLAERSGVQLVLVNDPDADRLAVAEYDTSAKSWKIFSGNEMGAILGSWLLDQLAGNPGDSHDDVYVIASVVSSKMLRAVVEGRGHFVETLTGFKWMGNTTLLLQQEGKRPVFAFEEAIGYMCSPKLPDKDGVSAAVQVASLASHLYSKGSTLLDYLNSLYKQYGYHVSHNSYFTCHDPAVIDKMFRRIRNYTGPGEYPKIVAGYEIVKINDLTTGVKIPDEKQEHLGVLGTGLDQDYKSGEMIMFQCANGLSVTVRTSGTEPKLKYYTELVCRADTVGEQEKMKIKLDEMVNAFIEELLEPEKYGLK